MKTMIITLFALAAALEYPVTQKGLPFFGNVLEVKHLKSF